MTLVSIARVRHREARYAEAEALFQNALAGLRKSLGAEHAYVSVTLNNLAVVYKEQGKLAAAEAQLRESLRIQEALFGVESVAAATVANNLGELHVRQGRYAEAEILYRRSLDSQNGRSARIIPTLPTNSPTSQHSLPIKVGQVRQKACCGGPSPSRKRRSGRIIPTLPRRQTIWPTPSALSIACKRLRSCIGARWPSRSTFRSGAIRRSRLPSTTLARSSTKTIGLQRPNLLHAARYRFASDSLGPTHPLMGNSLNNLASILDNLGRHEEAGPLLQRALKVREAVFGSAHPEVAVTLHNLASHYLDLQQWDAAFTAFKRASAIWITRRATGLCCFRGGSRG